MMPIIAKITNHPRINPKVSMTTNLEEKKKYIALDGTKILDLNTYSHDRLKFNKQKLRTFASLKKNWDGYIGAIFKTEVIKNVEDILTELRFQPQVFPTANGSVQIEKYFSDNKFYEIEIDECKIFAYIVDEKTKIDRVVSKKELLKLLNDLK